MQLDEFDFVLPDDLIALRPLHPRPASRLLVAGPGSMSDSTVARLGAWLRPGDLLVINDTKVIPARIAGVRRRSSGEVRIEATLIARRGDGAWRALARPGKRLVVGDVIDFGGGLSGSVWEKVGAEVILTFGLEEAALERALLAVGEMPLPPYIAARRAVDAQDREDYQTVFADRPGAVAAPTASLHFDERLMMALAAEGVRFARVTLHVGAGTFLPVKVENIEDHRMHPEWGEIGIEAAHTIASTIARGGRIIPVGTTALRLIETAATASRQIVPWAGETDIFIYPGYDFRIADGLMTNFHQPRSTLMMLVSALMGLERMREIYAHAINHRYRFFSYGDSSLLLPGG